MAGTDPKEYPQSIDCTKYIAFLCHQAASQAKIRNEQCGEGFVQLPKQGVKLSDEEWMLVDEADVENMDDEDWVQASKDDV